MRSAFGPNVFREDTAEGHGSPRVLNMYLYSRSFELLDEVILIEILSMDPIVGEQHNGGGE